MFQDLSRIEPALDEDAPKFGRGKKDIFKA